MFSLPTRTRKRCPSPSAPVCSKVLRAEGLLGPWQEAATRLTSLMHHPLDTLPAEIRLHIYRFCNDAALAALARAYPSNDAESTTARREAEEILYHRQVLRGDPAALRYAIEVGRFDPTIASIVLSKIKRYAGVAQDGSTPAFVPHLNRPHTSTCGDFEFSELPLVIAARNTHPDFFHVLHLAGADFVERTGPGVYAPARTWMNKGDREEWEMGHGESDGRRPGRTILWYALDRSLTGKPGDGPGMLRTIWAIMAQLRDQGRREGVWLETRARGRQIDRSTASQLSMAMGVRNRALYGSGFILAASYRQDRETADPCCRTLFESLACLGDPFGYLPRLLVTHEAMLNTAGAGPLRGSTALVAAVSAFRRRQFDLLVAREDTDLAAVSLCGRWCALSCAIHSLSSIPRPPALMIDEALDVMMHMIQALLHRGASVHQVIGGMSPLHAAITNIAADAMMSGGRVTNSKRWVIWKLLALGADPSAAATPGGKSAFEALLCEVVGLAGPRTVSQARLVRQQLWPAIRLFTEQKPGLLATMLPHYGCSTLCFAMDRRVHWLVHDLCRAGARLVVAKDARLVLRAIQECPSFGKWVHPDDLRDCKRKIAARRSQAAQ